jgi:hypothetical protein
MTPEQYLWLSVINKAVDDAKLVIERLAVAKPALDHGRLDPIKYRTEQRRLDQIKHEMNHLWFDQICEWAGIHRDHVFGLIHEAEREAGIA